MLRNRSDLPTAVHKIYRWYRQGHSVIADLLRIRFGQIDASLSTWPPSTLPTLVAK